MNEKLKLFKVVFKSGLDVIVECEEILIRTNNEGISSVMVQGAKKEIGFFNPQEIIYIQEL